MIGVSSELRSPTINIGSSTPGYSFKGDAKLLDLKRVLRYLEIFNIEPDIIRHSLFLDNNIKARISYVKLSSGENKIDAFESTLLCEGHFIESTKEKVEIKSDLILNSALGNYLDEVSKIYGNCVRQGNFGFKNNLGYAIGINKEDPFHFFKDSGIKVIIEPDFGSRAIIYFGFLALWISSLILLREGPIRFYWYIRDYVSPKK